MNKEQDKDLDDLFGKGLGSPPDYNEHAMEGNWARLEYTLERSQKHKVITRLAAIISGIAALLLLFFGWVIFNMETKVQSQKLVKRTDKHPIINTGTNGGPMRQTLTQSKILRPATVAFTVPQNNSKRSTNGTSFFNLSAAGPRRDTAGIMNAIKAKNPDKVLLSAVSNGTAPRVYLPVKLPDTVVNKKHTLQDLFSEKNESTKASETDSFHPGFAVTVIAAPDINGAGSFQQAKVGTNIGALFSATTFNKFSVATGILYSFKPYATSFENYNASSKGSIAPDNVTADCQMLDIPINVAYQVFNKNKNKISIGTGLSSYLMLHESYAFSYAAPYANWSYTYTVPKSGKYFFGVLNLNATLQRQINSHVSFTFQPYLKVPLTNIGYSQVRLQSAGVAVGLTWNILSNSRD